jgi:formimidoylglutamate deiminase
MIEIRPAWAWLPDGLHSGVSVFIDENGRIASVEKTDAPPHQDLEDVALFPGFVNAHSHAFQWGLRGLVQNEESEGNFFSWRDRMFDLANTLNPEEIYRLSLSAFKAMRASGYTAVGEFHYVHHQPDGTPYNRPTELAEAVIEAARKTGLRICLLHTAYLRPSGVDDRLSPGQSRFIDPSAEVFLARHQMLLDTIERMGDDRVTAGVAPHSIRTVPLEAISLLMKQTKGPFHLHINEQPREISESLKEYGMRPLEVVSRAGALTSRTTLVHMTHAEEQEIQKAAQSGATICFCPTTESDLGDGIGPSKMALEHGINCSIGSDSQVQMNPFEEMRLLEQNERLKLQKRLVLPADINRTLSHRLLDVGTTGGALSLDLSAGAIKPGNWADFMEINLSDLDLLGADPACIPDIVVFSVSPRAVRGTWVGGQRNEAPPLFAGAIKDR